MQRDDGSVWLADRHGQSLTAYHIPQGDSSDCGPHAVTMAVNFWRGDHLLRADEVARGMNQPRLRAGWPPLSIRRVPNWATFPWGIAEMLREYGLQATWRVGASEHDLHGALRADHLLLPIFGEPLRRRGWSWEGWGHVAVLVGWNPVTGAYWFVDSARRAAPNQRPRTEFMRYWRNMGRILIEAH